MKSNSNTSSLGSMVSTMTTTMMLALVIAATQLDASHAFTVMIQPPTSRSPTTRLHLQDWVADLIDQEMYRQNHKKEFEAEWMEKNRGAVMYHLNNGNENENFMNTPAPEEFRQHAKDQKLAMEHPEQYCADRCITTGNCEIYEDL